MTGAGGPRLHLDADLSVRVSDPRGRTGAVTVDDGGGVLRVRVEGFADLLVLLGSLPPGIWRAWTRWRAWSRRAAGAGGLRWDQDVDVVVGSRLLVRRRHGRWRPAPVALVPVLLLPVVAVLAVAVGARSRGRGRRGAAGRPT